MQSLSLDAYCAVMKADLLPSAGLYVFDELPKKPREHEAFIERRRLLLSSAAASLSTSFLYICFREETSKRELQWGYVPTVRLLHNHSEKPFAADSPWLAVEKSWCVMPPLPIPSVQYHSDPVSYPVDVETAIKKRLELYRYAQFDCLQSCTVPDLLYVNTQTAREQELASFDHLASYYIHSGKEDVFLELEARIATWRIYWNMAYGLMNEKESRAVGSIITERHLIETPIPASAGCIRIISQVNMPKPTTTNKLSVFIHNHPLALIDSWRCILDKNIEFNENEGVGCYAPYHLIAGSMISAMHTKLWEKIESERFLNPIHVIQEVGELEDPRLVAIHKLSHSIKQITEAAPPCTKNLLLEYCTAPCKQEMPIHIYKIIHNYLANLGVSPFVYGARMRQVYENIVFSSAEVRQIMLKRLLDNYAWVCESILESKNTEQEYRRQHGCKLLVETHKVCPYSEELDKSRPQCTAAILKRLACNKPTTDMIRLNPVKLTRMFLKTLTI